MTDQGRRLSKSLRRGSKTPPPPSSYSVKVVAVGDVDIGKSSMLLTYLSGHFPLECPPGPMDGHSEFDHMTQEPKVITQDNVEIRMTIVDTYSQDEYERLRERVCALADVYLLCYDVNRRGTFERIRHHWLPEIRKYGTPDTPFLLVGLKTDIRSKALAEEGSDASASVSYTQGLKEAEDLGAALYQECTAKSNPAGVKKVLDKAGHAAVQNLISTGNKGTSCVVS